MIPSDAKRVFLGTTELEKVCLGAVLLWEKPQDVIFVQPVLTANGTIGGDSFAVAANVTEAYKAFDNSASSYCNRLNADCWLEWYNPQPMLMESVQWSASGASYMQRAGLLQYSDDDSVWTTAVEWDNSGSENPFTVQVGESHGSHKYWRLYFTTKGTSSGNSDVSNVILTATL